MTAKPSHVLDREREWTLLDSFVVDPQPNLRIAIVSGRRRSGKSYLLEALATAVGGLYVTAVQEEGRVPALERFTGAVARFARVPPSSLTFQNWEDALTTALDVAGRSGAGLLVLDELPYLLQHSPEIPGLLQLLYDRSQSGDGPGGRIVLCGSALSVMHELLSGTRPLRGRAVVDLRMRAFDVRTARDHWQIENPQTALLLHACIGGAPGYRPLSQGSAPQEQNEFGSWLTENLLNPGRALYSRVETEFLLREDPRITQRTLYYDLLTAVAQGATTPTKIGGLLGRERASVVPPISVLESTGYVQRNHDLLRAKNPIITVGDPVIRFNQLITLPWVDLVEHGRADQVWQDAQPTFTSKILGPHFEHLAREWTRAFATDEAGLQLGTVGATEVPDQAARTKHEVDVIALEPGARPQTAGTRVSLVGEAKATVARRGMADVERLEHIRELLTRSGHDASKATIALYSLHGFHDDVVRAAAHRSDLRLIDLGTIYGDSPVLGV